MTPGMRLQMLVREAPRRYVVTAAFLAGILIGGLLVAVAGRGGDVSIEAGPLAGTPAVPGPGTPTTAPPPTAAPTGGGVATDAPPEPGTPQGEPARGTPPPVAGAGAEPAPEAPPQADPTGGDDDPSDTEVPDPGDAGPPPDPTAPIAPPEAPAASDIGVTAESILIGFVIYDIGGLDGSGYVLGVRQDVAEYLKAFVDHANAEGGVHGRRIDYVTTRQDPLSQSSQRQACITMTEDHKVFSVVEAGSTIGVAANCYPERQTPFLYGAAQTTSEDLFRQAGGYLLGTGPTGTRTLLNWARFAMADGFIGPGSGKLGILSDECAPNPDMFDGVFMPFLAGQGIDFMEVRLSCDLTIAQQQVPGAIVQFRQGGVDRVLPSVIFATMQLFTQQAQAQLWRPVYSCSDMYGLCQDIFAENFQPDQWDRTRGYTHTHSGEEAVGILYSDPVQRCSQILEAAGLPGIRDQMGADAAAVSFCDHFTLWVTAARQAPVNLTRSDFIRAVEGIGEYPTAYSQRAVFGPGKYSGGDSLATVEWQRECRCFHQIGPPQPGHD